MLGVDIPEVKETLVPEKPRSQESFSQGGVDILYDSPEPVPADPGGDAASEAVLPEGQKFSDFCACGHTRGSHYAGKAEGGKIRRFDECGVVECVCRQFRLIAAGIEGVEELPADPIPPPPRQLHEDENESAAIDFLLQLCREANMELLPEQWMALQRLIDNGWRFFSPEQTDG